MRQAERIGMPTGMAGDSHGRKSVVTRHKKSRVLKGRQEALPHDKRGTPNN